MCGLGHGVSADHDAVHTPEEVVTAVAVGSEIKISVMVYFKFHGCLKQTLLCRTLHCNSYTALLCSSLVPYLYIIFKAIYKYIYINGLDTCAT